MPQLVIPDNPRALVSKADRYEPLLTDSVRDFARHYGCSVLPARAYHPQDKPKDRDQRAAYGALDTGAIAQVSIHQCGGS